MRDSLVRRLFPLLAMVVLIAVGMSTTTWGPSMIGRSEWALPYDLWGTLVAATRLTHLDVGGLYTQPTGLVSLPGAAVILVPVAAVIDAAGLSLRIPGPDNLHPSVWLVAGPYQIALSCVVLFAADALAEQLGVSKRRRALLAAAGMGALWSVCARWGHPEDAVAVGFGLYSVLALSRSRTALAGWLAGAAVAVQPLTLLALPVLLAVLPWRRAAGFGVRAALPAVVLLGAAALANWQATVTAVARQPDSPLVNHPTAWTSLAPHLSGGNVAAGPARAVTILLACCCALLVRRRWLALVSGTWPAAMLADILWWAALTLALRSFFEPVMVSYYPWPALAVALIPAARGWRRLIAASVIADGLTAAAQGTSHDVWIWWVPLVAGLTALLAVARPGAYALPVPGAADGGTLSVLGAATERSGKSISKLQPKQTPSPSAAPSELCLCDLIAVCGVIAPQTAIKSIGPRRKGGITDGIPALPTLFGSPVTGYFGYAAWRAAGVRRRGLGGDGAEVGALGGDAVAR